MALICLFCFPNTDIYCLKEQFWQSVVLCYLLIQVMGEASGSQKALGHPEAKRRMRNKENDSLSTRMKTK